ncbi:hypothetical protein K2Y00_01010 [Patescibacteria group bacterium]|nr:hypothetical protein [Patescibacteria group bacterium]
MINCNTREIIQDGLHTKEVLNVLSNDIEGAALVALTEKATQILRRCVDPIAEAPEHPSDGLVYGLIQSGKTSVIQVTTAMAADNGFQCVVILTSDNEILYGQTLKRMKSVLQGLSVLGKTDWADPKRFARDLRNPPVVLVCSKNGTVLSGLLEEFKKAGARGLSALIIDDEADQASLNTNTSKAKKTGKLPSTINQVISDFRNFFRTTTYLQVTATPQALFLQNPDNRYRPSFTILSEPGNGYVGGDKFFGDKDDKLLRFVDIEEVEQLTSSHQPSPTGSIPKGLRSALVTFLVGATCKRIENPVKGYAFLCHVSSSKVDHSHICSLIESFKEDVFRILESPTSKQYVNFISELEAAYKDLETTQFGLPPFSEVLERMKFYLHGARVKLINSVSGDEVELDAAYNIFVGGNKLGRGVTIKNLLVSYYGRNPKKPNADTVLQHARMYGYRQDDLGVTRLFLPRKLAGHFSLIHNMESALRDVVEKYPEGKFEILYIASPLQATRRNVLDPESLVAYVAGKSINPSYPLRTPEMREVTKTIDERLQHIGNDEAAVATTIKDLISILELCHIEPATDSLLWNIKNIRTALEMIEGLMGDQAYLVVRRGREIAPGRGENSGILSGGEINLAPSDKPTLFLYRQTNKHGEEVWWPQLRFPESDRNNYVLSFSIEENES